MRDLAAARNTVSVAGADNFEPELLLNAQRGRIVDEYTAPKLIGILDVEELLNDGPGGLDIMSGGVPTCTGPDPNNCDPAPVSGVDSSSAESMRISPMMLMLRPGFVAGLPSPSASASAASGSMIARKSVSSLVISISIRGCP